MGTVFLARDPELDRRVALKVLHERQGNDEIRARFVREARLMAKLDHPNIVKVFDAGATPEGAFIVMELVEGNSLEAWLETQTHTVAETVEKFLMAGYALAAAHSAGIVHRDFKPANVLIDRKGRVAVTDFGIAAIAGTESASPATSATLDGSTPMTQVGAIMGTPAFMSPEQFRGEKADARSDQFSFAVALHEGVFREVAFDGGTLEELKAAVIVGTPRELPEAARQRAPAGIYEAIRRSLAKNPADRFPTMLVMLRELERCMADKPRKSRVPMLLVGGALAIGIAAAATFPLSRPTAAAEPPLPTSTPRPTPTPTPTPVESVTPTLTAGPLVGGAGKCLDATNPEQLEIRGCTGEPAQSWRLVDHKLLANDGRCVAQRTGKGGVRTFLALQTCNHDSTQQWDLDGKHLVASNGKCANVEHGKTEDGAEVMIWQCHDGPNGRWHFRAP
jgi:serine/threonine protein kinase